jgi:hypothetical protein
VSPVSRGRGKKNRSSSGPKGRRAAVRPLPVSDDAAWDPRPAGPANSPSSAVEALAELTRKLPWGAQAQAEARAWWPDSHAEVLAAAAALLDCATPTQLEDAVCDLLGQHWRHQFETRKAGLSDDEWLEGLLYAAEEHAGEPAVRRLLYGIAVTASPGLAGLATKLLSATTAGGEEPDWLQDGPVLTASPDVLLLHDAYGLRFGVLAHVTGPGGATRTYLYDVDLCHGDPKVLASGYHADTAAATAAWRGLVGPSAAHAEPVPADDDLLPHVLPTAGLRDPFFDRPLSDDHFTEIFRGDRVAFAIADALEAAGRPLAHHRSDPTEASALVDELVRRFRAWAATAGVELPSEGGPDDDVVAWLLDDWVSPGMTEDFALACSPHRIAAFTAYVEDDWVPTHRTRALALLEPWARYCLEHGNVIGEAAEHTLDWARRAVHEPARVAGGLGNHLNRPIDETTVTGPPLPAHVR